MGRYIDVDEFVDRLKKEILLKFDNTEVIEVEDLKSVINNMPIADVVEVVRCKDCVFLTACGNCFHFAGSSANDVKPDDFCSYGVRKEG